MNLITDNAQPCCKAWLGVVGFLFFEIPPSGVEIFLQFLVFESFALQSLQVVLRGQFVERTERRFRFGGDQGRFARVWLADDAALAAVGSTEMQFIFRFEVFCVDFNKGIPQEELQHLLRLLIVFA